MNICFSGHRPDNPNMGGYDFDNDKNRRIRLKMLEVIEHKIYMGNDDNIHFITGGALGVDQYAALICDYLRCIKRNRFNITTEVAIPYKDQYLNWNLEDIQRYFRILRHSNVTTYVDTLKDYTINGLEEGKHHPSKLELRNHYMVDNCDVLIAVWDGTKKGGTYNCIKYAKKLGKRIIYINPANI